MAEAIINASGYRETHELISSKRAANLTIALDRQSGVGGTAIAREVGDRLGWPVYDHELVERIANEMHLRKRLLESVDEKRLHWLNELVAAFKQEPHVTESAYVRHLVQTVLSLGTHGACIIVGRGSAQVLPSETTLRVRLVAPRPERVKNLALELGLDRDAAGRRLDEMDHQRESFIREHFSKTPHDPENYDLLLNAARFSRTECAELIIEALHRREPHTPAREPA
jgi:cytidylate kinase